MKTYGICDYRKEVLFKGDAITTFRTFQIKNIVVTAIMLKPHVIMPIGSNVTYIQSRSNLCCCL